MAKASEAAQCIAKYTTLVIQLFEDEIVDSIPLAMETDCDTLISCCKAVLAPLKPSTGVGKADLVKCLQMSEKKKTRSTLLGQIGLALKANEFWTDKVKQYLDVVDETDKALPQIRKLAIEFEGDLPT